jgi:carnitine O-acetyltransferase
VRLLLSFFRESLFIGGRRRDDPTPDRGSQLPRAAALIVSSLGFVHDLRAGLLAPDAVRGVPLDMSQYARLFATARIPTAHGCKMDTAEESRHVVVLRHGQFCEHSRFCG